MKEEKLMTVNEDSNKWVLFIGNLLQLLVTIINVKKWGENPKAVATTFFLIIVLVVKFAFNVEVPAWVEMPAVALLVALIGFFLRKWNIEVK